MSNPDLPERIGRLGELASNLWWSWHEPTRQMFRALDYPLWRTSGHNPVNELRDTSVDALQKAASTRSFLDLYDSVMSAFDTDMRTADTWFATSHPNLLHGPAFV